MLTEVVNWANGNGGFLTLLSLICISLLFPFGRWLLARFDRALGRARSEDEIRRIEGIRSEFYQKLKFIDSAADYGPVLIRDVARDCLYFDGDEKEFTKNKSPPSFKVGLIGLSVHGIRVYAGHFPTKIKQISDGKTWCLADDADSDAQSGHPIGVIPFSSIVSVNWHGDPAHTFPHVFCRFDGPGGWPYKIVEYCERRQMSEGWNLYEPLVDAGKVIQKKF
ncbi:MAG: hypothetical protein PHE83_12300 [Opitutaceae bacterium]|nr:hypothetical protein [Opitutaceae bacterium]